MPVIIPSALPAKAALEDENIFVMTEGRAKSQEIRPLSIGLLNLMPNKEETELELLRLISNTPLQVEITLLQTASYKATHTAEEHLREFYLTFDEAVRSGKKFDGLIVTGAPVEQMDFRDVKYWDEVVRIMDWAEHNVYSTLYICWGAIAAMYYFYGVNKVALPVKLSGVYRHRSLNRSNPIVRNFDEYFNAPHSRHSGIDEAAARKIKDLDILAESDEAGIYLAADKNLRNVYVFGHGEYDSDTLHNEYMRDKASGKSIRMPEHYYRGGVEGALPAMTWRAHESLLMSNWLNYCVYQATPYDIETIK